MRNAHSPQATPLRARIAQRGRTWSCPAHPGRGTPKLSAVAGELRQAEIDYIIDRVRLKIVAPIAWEVEGAHVKARVLVEAATSDLGNVRLTMDLTVNRNLPGKYTYQLRQAPAFVCLRRLDVRGTHTNRKHTGSDESWKRRTHKHAFRDACGDAFAYTPTDIPDTGSPSNSPDPREHELVFEAFCTECGIEVGGNWVDPPLESGAGPSASLPDWPT